MNRNYQDTIQLVGGPRDGVSIEVAEPWPLEFQVPGLLDPPKLASWEEIGELSLAITSLEEELLTRHRLSMVYRIPLAEGESRHLHAISGRLTRLRRRWDAQVLGSITWETHTYRLGTLKGPDGETRWRYLHRPKLTEAGG